PGRTCPPARRRRGRSWWPTSDSGLPSRAAAARPVSGRPRTRGSDTSPSPPSPPLSPRPPAPPARPSGRAPPPPPPPPPPAAPAGTPRARGGRSKHQSPPANAPCREGSSRLGSPGLTPPDHVRGQFLQDEVRDALPVLETPQRTAGVVPRLGRLQPRAVEQP